MSVQDLGIWNKKTSSQLTSQSAIHAKSAANEAQGCWNWRVGWVHWVHSRALRACFEPMKISSTARRLTEWPGCSMIHSGTYSCNIECKFCCSIEVVISATHLRVVSVKVYIILNSNYLLFCRWPEQCRSHARIEYLAEACNHNPGWPMIWSHLSMGPRRFRTSQQ